MPQPFALPLYCPACGRPFSVAIQLPRHFGPGQAPKTRIIQCPYFGCKGQVDPTIHGDIVGVWIGHGPRTSQGRLYRRFG